MREEVICGLRSTAHRRSERSSSCRGGAGGGVGSGAGAMGAAGAGSGRVRVRGHGGVVHVPQRMAWQHGQGRMDAPTDV